MSDLLPEVECPEPVEGRFWLYILLCTDQTLYVGQSGNVRERLRKHRYGLGSKHTSDHKYGRLVYVEELKSRTAAVGRERQIKRWSRAKKLALITGNRELLKKLAKGR